MAVLELKGRLDIFLMDPKTGEVIEERHVHNTIVDGGEIWVAEMLAGEDYANNALSYAAGELGYGVQWFQVGTDPSATVQTDYNVDTSGLTSTGAGHSYAVAVGTADIVSPGNEIVLEATFGTESALGDICECGLFSSSGVPTSSTDTASRMFSRVNFATISKTTAIELGFEWHITIGTVS